MGNSDHSNLICTEKCESLMCAVYRTLVEHGYANLSMAKIAEEYDKGKSNIYYHYENKEELMNEFLDHLLRQIKHEMDQKEGMNPDKKLEIFLEQTLAIHNHQQMWEFRKAAFEMRAQAPYKDKFAEKFKEIDRIMIEHLSSILEEKKIENPKEKSEIIQSAVEGAVDRKIAKQEQKEMEGFKESIKSLINNFG